MTRDQIYWKPPAMNWSGQWGVPPAIVHIDVILPNIFEAAKAGAVPKV